MTPEQIEIERKAFEAEHQRFDLSGDIGDWTKKWHYDAPIIDAMWSGWLEATLASLEDCVDDSREAVYTYVAAYGENFRPQRLARIREYVAKADAAIEAARTALKD